MNQKSSQRQNMSCGFGYELESPTVWDHDHSNQHTVCPLPNRGY